MFRLLEFSGACQGIPEIDESGQTFTTYTRIRSTYGTGVVDTGTPISCHIISKRDPLSQKTYREFSQVQRGLNSDVSSEENPAAARRAECKPAHAKRQKFVMMKMDRSRRPPEPVSLEREADRKAQMKFSAPSNSCTRGDHTIAIGKSS